MMMRTTCHAEERMGVRGGLRSLVASLCVPACLLTAAHAQDRETPLTFAVVGSQFPRRAPEDAGEARICICHGNIALIHTGRDAFRRLNGELPHLKPLLSMADPVEWATTKESGYAATGLLGADQAVVIVVFDRRYFSRRRNNRYHTPSLARRVVPVPVSVRIPTGVAVKDVETVYGSLDGGSWICRDGHRALTAEMVDSAQVYVALRQRPRRMPEKGLSQ